MKVNISGRGRVPGIGTLAPVRGYDASKEFVLRLLNYKQFKVFDAASGGLITKTNVDKLFAPKVETPVVEAPKKPATKKAAKKEEVVETPKSEPIEVAPEVTAEEVTQSFIEDVEAVSDQLPTAEELKEEYHPNVTVTEVPDEIGIDLAQNLDTVIETSVKIPAEEEAPVDEEVSTDEEKPAYYNKKKNKKNKNRNNNNE
jgi:hypothetical protein